MCIYSWKQDAGLVWCVAITLYDSLPIFFSLSFNIYLKYNVQHSGFKPHTNNGPHTALKAGTRQSRLLMRLRP